MKNMEFKRHLPVPKEIKEKYPLSRECADIKAARDSEISDIIAGRINKLLVITGPCSADREDAVLEYCLKLAELQEKVKDKILLVPRVFTGKPRTTGDGYKGIVHRPDPEKEPDMLEGIIAYRRIHQSVLKETGLSTSDEMLYPQNFRYISDLVSYVTVGARSVENQEHRLVASGLDIPVGMKNPPSGDFSVMLNSVTAARHPHTFIYRGWEVETKGNPEAHSVLRGYIDRHGNSTPNYYKEDIETLIGMQSERGLDNSAVLIDLNHANSDRNFEMEPVICKSVLGYMKDNNDIKTAVRGFLIESYLQDGSQEVGGGVYGKSITDPCLGWDKTEKLIFDIAESI